MELRITTISAEDHEAAKDVLRRAGFEVHESRPVRLTWALTFHADLTDMERLKVDLSTVAPTALVNPVMTGTGRPG
jgi:phosphoribosylformylglycinamidine (FGAM) synthase PurS component